VVPRDTPEAAIAEAALAGAHVFTIDGTIATAGRAIASVAPALGWFDLATLKEPYRLEGKKTMGLELAEQLGWDAPDVLVYPTGGGTGLVGIWKAYEELGTMGWVKAGQPRFVAVQAEGCAPLVRAWKDKAETTTPVENPVTNAPACACPGPSRAGRCSGSCGTPAVSRSRSARRRSSRPSGCSPGWRASGPRPKRRRLWPRSFT